MKRTTLASLPLVIAAGCSSPSVVTWQDNGVPFHEHSFETWWNYQFVYHPSTQSYFEPWTQTHIWFEGDAWRMGSDLPRGLNPDPRYAQVVKVRSDLPFLQHAWVHHEHPCWKELPERFDPFVHGAANAELAVYDGD